MDFLRLSRDSLGTFTGPGSVRLYWQTSTRESEAVVGTYSPFHMHRPQGDSCADRLSSSPGCSGCFVFKNEPPIVPMYRQRCPNPVVARICRAAANAPSPWSADQASFKSPTPMVPKCRQRPSNSMVPLKDVFCSILQYISMDFLRFSRDSLGTFAGPGSVRL